MAWGSRNPSNLVGTRNRPQRKRRSPKDQALVKHVHAILHPFHADEWVPCTPTDNFPSRKIRAYARGTFVTSTVDNWGFLLANPSLANNDGGFTRLTNGALAGIGIGTNGAAFTTNSPFAGADFSAAALRCRIHTCGIRVRNITNIQNRAGTLFSVKSPSDGQLSGMDASVIIGLLEPTGNAVRCDTSGNSWQTVCWVANDSDSTTYNAAATPNSNATLMSQNMAFVAQSPVGVQQTYEWEYICHGEVIDNANGSRIGTTATFNEPHLRALECAQIVQRLHQKPEFQQNFPNPEVANYIVDAVNAGEAMATVVADACTLAQKIAPIAESWFSAIGSIL